MGVHEEVCHGGRTKIEKILGRAWQSRASTSDTALPRSLPDLSGNKREEEDTKTVHKPIITDAVGQQ